MLPNPAEPLAGTTSPLAPGDTIGPYLIQSELGAGGMGRVFVAERPGSVESYAVKVVRDELARDPVITRRFLREAAATTRVSHPRLVEVVDSGTADGRPFLVMHHMMGAPLDRVVDERGPLDPTAVQRMVRDVAGALDALHKAGLVHRDVKPSNIMLDDDGRATLMDLGLAHDEDLSVLTRTGRLVGTLAYLSPERIRASEKISGASDVYALGCVAFEALAGRPPYIGNMFEIGMGHLEHSPPSLQSLRPELSPGLSEAIELAMAKEPTRRPPTATAFAVLLSVAGR